ncbi:MAG: DUF6036 family nucleotidyltransferase [Raoultibacter sp.]
MNDFAIEGILKRFAQLDDDLVAHFGYSGHFEIVVIGGSALILANLAPESRFTTDIDVLMASAEVETFFDRYDMNTDAVTFLYQYPENWEARRKKLDFDGQVLDIFTLSNEDLAITKLLAWRNTDKEDLLSMKKAGSVDVEMLWAILDDPTEVQIGVSEEEWTKLLKNAEEFMRW